MLAYVFWHRPRPRVEVATYESRLAAFHESLAAAPPPHFLRSAAFRLDGAPWAPAGSLYEDWYVLTGSAALDPLNDAAITASRQGPHDAVAAIAEWGTAGLYRLREGEPALPGGRTALWLPKPADQPYDAFYREVREHAGAGGWSLWGRQMVLGPTPEFCLHTPRPPAPPLVTRGVPIRLEPVWPRPS